MKINQLCALALVGLLAACSSSKNDGGQKPLPKDPGGTERTPAKPATPDVETVTWKPSDCYSDCVTPIQGRAQAGGTFYRFGDKWSAAFGGVGNNLFVLSHPDIDTWHNYTLSYDFSTGNIVDLKSWEYGLKEGGQILHDESASIRVLYNGLLESDLTTGTQTIHKFGNKAHIDQKDQQLAVSLNGKTAVLFDKSSLFIVDRIAHKVSYRLKLAANESLRPWNTLYLWYKYYSDEIRSANASVVSENGRFVALIITRSNPDKSYDFVVRVWDAIEEKSWEIPLLTKAEGFRGPRGWGVTPDGHLIWSSSAGKGDTSPIGLYVTRLSDGTLVNTIDKDFKKDFRRLDPDFDGDKHILIYSRMINVLSETYESGFRLCTGDCPYAFDAKWSDDRKMAMSLGNGKFQAHDKQKKLIHSMEYPKEIDMTYTTSHPFAFASSDGHDFMLWRPAILKRGADYINLKTGAFKHFEFRPPTDDSVRDYVKTMRVMRGQNKLAISHTFGMLFYDLP